MEKFHIFSCINGAAYQVLQAIVIAALFLIIATVSTAASTKIPVIISPADPLIQATDCVRVVRTPDVLRLDRFTPRIDQGERLYHFWFNAGTLKAGKDAVDREVLVKNEKPVALSFFPPGSGEKPAEFCRISGKSVQLVSSVKAGKAGHLTVRLFEPGGIKTEVVLEFPFAGFKQKLKFNPL